MPFPSPGALSDPGIGPESPALQADSLPLRHQGSPPGDIGPSINILRRGLSPSPFFLIIVTPKAGFPGGSVVKNLPVMQETQVRSLGQEDPLKNSRNVNPLQYSCLENPWTEEPSGIQSTGLHESDTA